MLPGPGGECGEAAASQKSGVMSTDFIHRGPDLNAVIALLAAARLPVEDLTAEHCENFYYLGAANLPNALVGLEVFGDVALLRSLAVAQGARGAGSGSRLLAHAEAGAREMGVKRLYLLTTTAEKFFASRNYTKTPRESAPDAIRRTREFSGICPASSAFMVKHLQG